VVEPRQRTFRIFLRELHVPTGRFSRIKRGRQFQGGRHFAGRVVEVSSLQELPRAFLVGGGRKRRQIWRHDRMDEIRIMRCGERRQRDRFRLVGARRRECQ
jgi:hypothetical protein